VTAPRFKPIAVSGGRHFARLRLSGCCVPGCLSQDIVVHHVRDAAHAGTGLKPPPWCGINICHWHHTEGHQKGWETTGAKYKVDFARVARGQAEVSRAMGLLPEPEDA
jgi:hypothetical protein